MMMMMMMTTMQADVAADGEATPVEAAEVGGDGGGQGGLGGEEMIVMTMSGPQELLQGGVAQQRAHWEHGAAPVAGRPGWLQVIWELSQTERGRQYLFLVCLISVVLLYLFLPPLIAAVRGAWAARQERIMAEKVRQELIEDNARRREERRTERRARRQQQQQQGTGSVPQEVDNGGDSGNRAQRLRPSQTFSLSKLVVSTPTDTPQLQSPTQPQPQTQHSAKERKADDASVGRRGQRFGEAFSMASVAAPCRNAGEDPADDCVGDAQHHQRQQEQSDQRTSAQQPREQRNMSQGFSLAGLVGATSASSAQPQPQPQTQTRKQPQPQAQAQAHAHGAQHGPRHATTDDPPLWMPPEIAAQQHRQASERALRQEQESAYLESAAQDRVRLHSKELRLATLRSELEFVRASVESQRAGVPPEPPKVEHHQNHKQQQPEQSSAAAPQDTAGETVEEADAVEGIGAAGDDGDDGDEVVTLLFRISMPGAAHGARVTRRFHLDDPVSVVLDFVESLPEVVDDQLAEMEQQLQNTTVDTDETQWPSTALRTLDVTKASPPTVALTRATNGDATLRMLEITPPNDSILVRCNAAAS